MNRLQKLQNRAASIVSTMKGLSDKLSAEDRVAFDEEEQKQYDALKSQLAEVETAIGIEEKIAAEEKKLTAKTNVVIGGNSEAEKLTEKKPEIRFPTSVYSSLKAFKGEDAKLNAYKTGRFMLATLGKDSNSAQWCRENGVELLAPLGQYEGRNTYGGYLVPPQMESAIITLREQYGVFRRNVRVLPMSGDTLSVNRRASGLSSYYLGEGDSITASAKTFDQVQLVAKKLGVLAYWSNEINDDAIISMADNLTDEIAYAFALAEDQAGFIGDGTSNYGGIVGLSNAMANVTSNAGIYTSPTAGHNIFSGLTLTDFHSTMALLPQYAYAQGPKWYCHQAFKSAVMDRLMAAGGGNTISTIGGSIGGSFLGYPVETSQVLNSTQTSQNSTVVCYFGVLPLAAKMGSRKEISIATSDQVAFTSDQMAIRGIERFDINFHDVGSSSAAGPMVAFKTSAS